ncbi:MAG: TetR/AcrR family transcriptional regulator [Chloroflexi bacterium]|nr:MAG: TetR/AcrR family transcriptional regulator [Chloroflexota bacterium]
MPKGIPLTEQDQACRRREIFSAAVNLFLEKGFQETSMREIAEAAKIGKSTLYDYFANKDDILLFVLEEETQNLTNKAREIAERDILPSERLRQIIKMHLEYMQQNRNLFARLTFEVQRLNFLSQQSIQKRRYEYQDVVREVIEEGIRDRSFRKVDSLLAARLIINSLISILYTSRPTADADAMLEETLSIFFVGIQA